MGHSVDPRRKGNQPADANADATPILAVRKDATGALVDDGDYSPLQTDSDGNLKVKTVGVSTTEYTEDTPSTGGEKGPLVLAVRNDSGGAMVSGTGDYTALQTDADGNLRVVSSGVTSTEFAEDSPHTTGDKGAVALTVRRDTRSSGVNADGDYAALGVNASGELYVKHTDAIPVTDNGGSITVDGSVGVTGTVSSSQSGTWNVGITGTPTVTVGNVSIPVTQSGAWSVTASGTVAATQSGTWNVGITGTPTVTLGAGSASVGTVTVGNASLAATQSGTWNVGITGTPTVTIGAGVATIGTVNAAQSGAWTVAATQSGTWNIGSITTLPALPTGANTIGAVNQAGTWNVGVTGTVAATQSGTWNIGSITTLPALAAGSNTIGAVNQAGSWTVTANAGTGTMAVVERGATIASTSASVTTTSGQIVASSATRRAVVLTNLGTDYVWIGASGVTDNQGIRLAPGQAVTIDRSPNAAIHAKAASGTQTVAIFTESD